MTKNLNLENMVLEYPNGTPEHVFRQHFEMSKNDIWIT